MKIYLYFILSLSISNKTFPQVTPDTSRLRHLTEQGERYKVRRHGKNMSDLDTAKNYFNQALALSGDAPDSSKYSQGHLLMTLGEVSFAQHNIPECKRYFLQSIAYAQRRHNLNIEAEGWQRLGDALSFTERKSAPYFAKAIAIYEQLNKRDKVIYNYFLYGMDRAYAGQIDSATKIAVQVIEKYKNTKLPNLEMLYYVASAMNRTNGNLDKALSFALGGVRRMNAVRDTSKGGTLYGELAEVYQATGDLENSIYYYKKAIVIREKKNPRQQFIFTMAGFVVKQLIKQKKAVEGLKYITMLESRHPPDSEFDAGLVAQIKAYCYEAMGMTAQAENNYLVMIKGLGQDHSNIGKFARLDMARFYSNQKKPQQAGLYLQDLKTDDAMMSTELELLRFKVDSLSGQLPAALKHFQRFKIINDSVFNSSRSKQIQQLQIQYETEQKNNAIKLLKSDSLFQQAEVKRANYMRNITLAGIILLLLFSALLYKGYRFKQRKNEFLNRLNSEKDGLLIEKDKLLIEKQWLLKEIHHRVKNNLAIVMGLLNRQSAYIDNEVALAAIQNSQNRMRSIALIHQKLYQSECLDLIQMPEYIEELIEHLKDSFDLGTRIIFEKHIAELYLDVSQAVPLGLIINEAITNAIKYAYPGEAIGVIHISLVKGDPDQNILLIKDNGPGFKKAFDPNKINSLGMNLMRGLNKQLGGGFEMTEDHGILVKIIFKTEVFAATSQAVS